MAYFPMFVELNNQNVLIVGGGKVALRKVEKLLPYGASITVAAPQIDEKILSIDSVHFVFEPFSPQMLNGVFMVIAATDDSVLNHKIATQCKEKKIPVNVVDNRNECSFIFPALLKRGQMSIGVSSGGASPTAAVWCRDLIASILPDNLPRLIDCLDAVRPLVMSKIKSEKIRSAVFKAMFTRSIELGRDLEETEIAELMEMQDDE